MIGVQVGSKGLVRNKDTQHVLKPYVNSGGYLGAHVTIKNDDGEYKCWRVHRLVYVTHKGPIPDGNIIDHKNSCTWDNDTDNLVALTQQVSIISMSCCVVLRLSIALHRP